MKTFILIGQIALILGALFSICKVLKTTSSRDLSKMRYDGILFLILFYILIMVNVISKGGVSVSMDQSLVLNFLGLLLGLIILYLQNLKELHFNYMRELKKLNSNKNN